MRRYHDPLFDADQRRHPALGFLLLFLLLLLAAGFLFNRINNSRVRLEKQSVTVPVLPSSLENFRILHISDLHGLRFGTGQERLAAALQNVSYDIVCLTGDLTDDKGNADALIELLALFSGKPVYFISGDEDPEPLSAVPHGNDTALADYILRAQEAGAFYLDAPVKITKGSGVLWLSPEWVYTLDAEGSQKALTERKAELEKEAPSLERAAALTAVDYQLDRLSRIRAMRREVAQGDVHIALTHHPLQKSAMASLREWTETDNDSYIRTVSLVLSGHYVSGQWVLPLLGPVRAPESAETGNGGWFPGAENVTGLTDFYGIPQYISPGLGASRAIGLPGFRLFNTPTVSLITLTSKLIY